MSKIITLRKGLDINLQGKAVEKLVKLPLAPEYAVSPLDFEGVTPKLLVKAGDRVKAGTPLFFNKYNERVVFTSPVSGTVSAINRGEKRCILNVTVQADATQMYEEFAKLNVQTASREEIIDLLLKSGLWPMIIQRPYGIIAIRATHRRPFSFRRSIPHRWLRITISCWPVRSGTSKRVSKRCASSLRVRSIWACVPVRRAKWHL